MGRHAARWRGPVVVTVTYCLSCCRRGELSGSGGSAPGPSSRTGFTPRGRPGPTSTTWFPRPCRRNVSRLDPGQRQGWAPPGGSSPEGVTNEWDSTRGLARMSHSGYDAVQNVAQVTSVGQWTRLHPSHGSTKVGAVLPHVCPGCLRVRPASRIVGHAGRVCTSDGSHDGGGVSVEASLPLCLRRLCRPR